MVRLISIAYAFVALFPTSCFAARVLVEETLLSTGTISSDEGWGGEFSRRRRSGPIPPSYAGVDTPPRHDCASEYTLGGVGRATLPDLIGDAHRWCRSDLVPEHLRVPERMRGLYWMKGLGLSDVAFCPSLAEWDAERLTARLPVWMTFVVGKQPEEEIPQLILDTSGMGSRATLMGFALGKHPLIYHIQFLNSSLTEAIIVPSAWLFRTISRHPMIQKDVTDDGTFTADHPGDIFDRPSFFFGRSFGSYEAVKVMYDDGTVKEDVVTAMRAAEIPNNVTYMRYAPTC